MSDETPLPNGSNGRDEQGRFAPGWKGGPGNPLGKRMEELKTALLECTTAEQVRAVMEKLHALAVSGDVAAARVWLDRVFGRAPQSISFRPDIEPPDPREAVESIRRLLGI